jgi:hypothetical protein
MNELKVGEHDILSYVKPDTLWGALAYFVIFVLLAIGLSRALRTAVRATLAGSGKSIEPRTVFCSKWARP